MTNDINSDYWVLMTGLAERWSGFSLEKRDEWRPNVWRARTIPNKQERQHMRLEAYATTPGEALSGLSLKVYEASREAQ